MSEEPRDGGGPDAGGGPRVRSAGAGGGPDARGDGVPDATSPDRPGGGGQSPDGNGQQFLGRDETEDERADRRWTDLLQELRVAQTGVQILFGFLLAVAFQPRFDELSGTDQAIYTVTVLLGAATTGVLVSPVAIHRIVTGRRIKPAAVGWASRLTALGLGLMLCTVVSALLLILRLVVDNGDAFWMVVGMFLLFALLWIVLPLWLRARERRGR